MNLQDRLVYLQSWWVASELLRRHPELELIETHPGGGLYDCLTIVSREPTRNPVHIDLNRTGRMHIHSAVSPKLDRHTWDIAVPVEWSDEHLQDDRRKVPRVLEAAVDLQAPTQTPMTTEKTLVFRVIYQLLLFALNETRDWEARNALFDSAGIDAEWDPNYFADISSARDAMADSSKQANRQSGFWAMLRDGRCLALLQEDGTLHRPGAEPENMMRLYDAAHRDILGASLKVRQLIIAQA